MGLDRSYKTTATSVKDVLRTVLEESLFLLLDIQIEAASGAA
jgi:NhaP-type Na+/H+ or K+/H+ antiporter